MAQRFSIELTQGNSEGNYDIYYNQIGSAFFATAITTNTITTNLSYASLSVPGGVQVAIPDSANRIIIKGLGVCNNDFIYPVTPIVTPPQIYNFPILCFSYGEITVTEYLTFQPNTTNLVNGKGSWTSGSYIISWNLTTQRWELVISSLLTLVSTYTSTDGVPDGNWVGLGTLGALYTTNVERGICKKVVTLETFTEQTPNSCLKDPKSDQQNCDGVITILRTSGGVLPYQYSIDGVSFRTTPVFGNLCPGDYEVTTKDSAGNTTTNRVTIDAGTQPTTYNLTLTNRNSVNVLTETYKSTSNNWTVNFPTLVQGTTFSINLTFNVTSIVREPGNGRYLNTLLVAYDGIEQTPTSIISDIVTTPRPDCSSNNQIKETKTFTYTIDYTVGGRINGIVTSNQTLAGAQTSNGCATEVETLVTVDFQLSRLTCDCCQINPPDSITLIDSLLKATTNIVNYRTFCLNYGTSCYEAINPPPLSQD